MDLGDVAKWFGIFVLAVVLLALVIGGWLMWRYRIGPKGLIAIGVAAAYLVSPIDVLPEAILGPVGLIDDTGVLAGTAFFLYRIVKARQALVDAGVTPRSRRRKP